MAPRRLTIAESFDDHYLVDEKTGCWNWVRARDSDGYGHFVLNGRWQKAHRYAYERVHGPLAAGLKACHRCDNPPCVNPAHIFAGTNSDNMKDATRKGRAKAPVFTGEAHGMAIVTEAEVLEIRRRRAAGERRVDVARRIGISPELTYRIEKRKIWRHI